VSSWRRDIQADQSATAHSAFLVSRPPKGYAALSWGADIHIFPSDSYQETRTCCDLDMLLLPATSIYRCLSYLSSGSFEPHALLVLSKPIKIMFPTCSCFSCYRHACNRYSTAHRMLRPPLLQACTSASSSRAPQRTVRCSAQRHNARSAQQHVSRQRQVLVRCRPPEDQGQPAPVSILVNNEASPSAEAAPIDSTGPTDAASSGDGLPATVFPEPTPAGKRGELTTQSACQCVCQCMSVRTDCSAVHSACVSVRVPMVMTDTKLHLAFPHLDFDCKRHTC
jgi:hypothetical protein